MKEAKPLYCDKCKMGFNVYSSFYSHNKHKHQDPNIRCPHCLERFHTIGLRNAHYYRAMQGTTKKPIRTPKPKERTKKSK